MFWSRARHGEEETYRAKPTTQGKIERFQTFAAYYPKFNNIEQFRKYYNNKPHAALKYKKSQI